MEEWGQLSRFGLRAVTVLAGLHAGMGCCLTDQEEAKSHVGRHALCGPGG